MFKFRFRGTSGEGLFELRCCVRVGPIVLELLRFDLRKKNELEIEFGF